MSSFTQNEFVNEFESLSLSTLRSNISYVVSVGAGAGEMLVMARVLDTVGDPPAGAMMATRRCPPATTNCRKR